MGCGNSKVEELPLVALCRERRELIRAAADHRYSLAAAHASYFRALDRVGEALHRFVTEELTAVPSAPSSPVLTLLPSDGKSKSKSDGSTANGSIGSVGGGFSSSFTSSCSVSNSSHLHLPEEDSHLHVPSGSESQKSFGEGSGMEGIGGYSAYPPHFSSFPNPKYYYMKSSSTIPSTIYLDLHSGRYGYPHSYYYYEDHPMMSAPRENVATSTADLPHPPPPPVLEGSSWDFFNPFNSYDQIFPEYFKGRYGLGSGSVSSPDSSEIREKEGIPDLEEETEPESMREVEEKKKVDGDLEGVDSGIGISKTAPLREEVGENTSAVLNEKESKRIHVGEEMSSGMKETYVRKKEVSFEEEDSLVTEESGSGNSLVTEESGSGNGIALHVHGTKDVVEAVKEIKEQFKLAAGCGEEVSRLLEVGKLQYRSKSRLLRVIFSRILDSMALSALTSSSHSSNYLQRSDASMPEINEAANSEYISMKSENLSSTLEKLYIWEKKLYKEVKDEEKLRVIYERECRRLKALDDGGAESYKIDSTRAAIRKLLTKISIAIKSVDAISSRIHKLRDEELRPQLIELIQGSITMWKSMLDCHQKQFQAIVESKRHNLTARTRIQRNSVAKATMEFELELLNWCSCFRNWISTQKAYIEALNEWLMKWLLQEQEETPDGVVPFSPSRMGAPIVFIVSNDWQHAEERISEVGVMTAMHIFAANVHKLWESQDEEQRQNLKAEYLSRDLSRRFKSLQKENGLQGHLDASDKRAVYISNNGEAFHDDRAIALDSMRKRLDEERAKHQETVKQVQEATSSSLQTGLIPVFEALGNYASETLKAYVGVRIQNDEGT